MDARRLAAEEAIQRYEASERVRFHAGSSGRNRSRRAQTPTRSASCSTTEAQRADPTFCPGSPRPRVPVDC
jgi:hypothetical protein